MNERHKSQLIEVTQKHLDGIANEQEVHWLSELLEADSTARETYLDLQDIHAGVTTSDTEDLTANLLIASDSEHLTPRKARNLRDRRYRQFRYQSPTSARLSCHSGRLVDTRPIEHFSAASSFEEATLIRLNELSGQVTWIGNGGQIKSSLKPGDCLSGGTMELGAPDAHVSFTYEDGLALPSQDSPV